MSKRLRVDQVLPALLTQSSLSLSGMSGEKLTMILKGFYSYSLKMKR